VRRLDSELAVIGKMGFAGYFLIVADFINWASATISRLAWAAVRAPVLSSPGAWHHRFDPLRYGLLFERSESERVSMPDFDVDFY
jgi:DNA polymerase-3 subunit alpha